MSTSDGYVVGATKIVDHGPDTARWNLVIVADGYQSTRAGELPRRRAELRQRAARHAALQRAVLRDQRLPHRRRLESDSGADDPGCGGNAPVTANTYFDAKFCSLFSGSPLERLLTIDDGLAISVANTYVPLKHQVLCIVNSTKYGGSGGSVATCSVNAQATQIAIHEMGHSAFGLADEYGGNGAGTPAGEPSQPNVTRDTNRSTNKWRALIAATTPMPSQCDGTCVGSDLRSAGDGAGAGRGRHLRRCDLLELQHLPPAALVLHARLQPVLPGLRRRDPAGPAAVPAGRVDHARHAQHLLHQRACWHGWRRRHHPPRDSLRRSDLPDADIPDHGRSDRRLRHALRHVGHGVGRSDRTGGGGADLALLHLDQSRRHRQRDRHRPLCRNRADLGDQHQREHDRATAHRSVARARPFGQHERRRRRWRDQGRRSCARLRTCSST